MANCISSQSSDSGQLESYLPGLAQENNEKKTTVNKIQSVTEE